MEFTFFIGAWLKHHLNRGVKNKHISVERWDLELELASGLVTLITLITLVTLVTLGTLFWSANQLFRGECIAVSGFFFKKNWEQ